MPLPIEQYAAVGDTGTVGLIGLDGSVDWLCLPRFDSAACFAAILGTPDNGRWLLGPAGEARSTRRYVGDSFVLETRHETDTGVVEVVDLMPLRDHRADLIRRVRGISGTVRMRHEWVVRLGYGKIRPWVSRRHDVDGRPMITATAGPDTLVLRGTRLPVAQDGRHVDEFEVRAGDELQLSLTWCRSHHDVPGLLDVEDRIAQTLATSREWASMMTYDGPYRDQVSRSLLVLRILTHGGTGGIVAAPTTSLPELIGGSRNWDYRYCWLRDASLTLDALIATGYRGEIEPWRGWLLRALAGDPQDAQIVYTVDGGRELPERELEHLPGYESSSPVRIGNGAVDQRQTDVIGEVMAALEHARQVDPDRADVSWELQRALVDELCRRWQEPDSGLWEMRGPSRHFTHSRVMVWVALDAAIAGVERHGLPGEQVKRWREVRDLVRAEILDRGYDRDRGTFVQYYGGGSVDAALLLIPLVGFLPGDDPRVLGTIAAVEQDLMTGGLVRRYLTDDTDDGVPGDEHPFLACSFWLVGAYAMAGRLADARTLMDRLIGLLNDVGLLAEEYDPVGHRMTGNFPQAFSHLALVNAAIHLGRAEGACADQRSG